MYLHWPKKAHLGVDQLDWELAHLGCIVGEDANAGATSVEIRIHTAVVTEPHGQAECVLA